MTKERTLQLDAYVSQSKYDKLQKYNTSNINTKKK